MAAYPKDAAEPDEPGEAVQAQDNTAAPNRDRARELTRQVGDKARAGDCSLVVDADREIREIDPWFHTMVFQPDWAIRKCLDAAAPVQAPAEQPAASP